MVAGIVAALTNNNLGIAGVNWRGYIWDACVSNPEKPRYVDPGKVYGAFMECIDHGCDVINCSWGGYTYNPEHQAAVVEAYNSGIAVCGAAGNQSTSETLFPAA